MLVIAAFVALCSKTATELAGQRIVLFSYGSGFASSMYSLRASHDASAGSPLAELVASLANLKQRLEARHKVAPEEFNKVMQLREDTHHQGNLRADVLPS